MNEITLTNWVSKSEHWPDLLYWVKIFSITLLAVFLIWLTLKISLFYIKKYGVIKITTVFLISTTGLFLSYHLVSKSFTMKTTEWQENGEDSKVSTVIGHFSIKYASESIGLSILDLNQQYDGFEDKVTKELVNTGLFRTIYPLKDSASWLDFGEVEMMLTVSLEECKIESLNIFSSELSYILNYELKSGVRTDYPNESPPYSLNMPEISGRLTGKSKVSGIFTTKWAEVELKKQIINRFTKHLVTNYCSQNEVKAKRFTTELKSQKSNNGFLPVDLKIPSDWQMLRQFELPGVMFSKRQHNRFLVKGRKKEQFFKMAKAFVFDNGFGFGYNYGKKNAIEIKPEKIVKENLYGLFGRAFYNFEKTQMIRISYIKINEVKFKLGNEKLIDNQDYFLIVEIYQLVPRDEWGDRVIELLSECRAKGMNELVFSLANTDLDQNRINRKQAMDYILSTQPENLTYLFCQASLAEGEEAIRLKNNILKRIGDQSSFYGEILTLQTEIESIQNNLKVNMN